jgi:hypothetical protein
VTPDEIAADRAVIDAATRRAGPWAALGTRLLEDTGGCTCGPGGLNGLHEPYCGAEPVAEGSPDVIAFLAAARPGWPSALDALEAAQEGNDRLGAMVEWLAEVIVDARDACQRAESIEPSGSPEWVESGIAMRTTVLREVRAILDRERTAHPSALDKVTDRAEKAETEITALRERVADLEGQLAMRGTP